MEDLVERIVRWKIHPEDLVTNRFALEKVDEAYALMGQRQVWQGRGCL
jgi:threonine dehydrogenase-like Zn-dependent dehydrogenase